MQLDGLQQYIRFAISQLSAQNGQAEFEKVCLYFGRFRIHKNILPATGPVQAGGDQGRDFETFHSYLAKSNIASSSFVAEYSEKPVAFACSLEKNPTKKNGKIVSDVKIIMSGGVPVNKIYFFSGQDIPVAMRHKAQAAIKSTYAVDLEVIDAQALAQHLCDTDLFWVAAQFLKVPSEYYPEHKEENWYTKLLTEYRERTGSIKSFEEFEDVKSAIRFVYKKDDFKSDLAFWLPKLDQLIAEQRMTDQLVRKAIYEKFVASLIGLDFVEGQEANIQQYFEHFEDFLSTSDLEDAQHLLSFCQTSCSLGRHHLPKYYLDDVTTRMENLLSTLIDSAPTLDNKCALLEIQANLFFHDRRGDLDFEKNIDRFVAGLDELLDHLDQTHFYPIGRLSDRLNDYLRILLETTIDISDIEEITTEVDEIFARKAGAGAAGQKLKDRAIVYLESGDNNKAIRILHDVKLKWFNQDTIRGTLLTCLLLAKTYQKQELYFAAKYYALVAAYLAYKAKDTALSDKMVEGISIAADCDYGTGAWVTYMRMITLLLGTHALVTKDFDVFDNNDTLRLLYYPAVILEAARQFLPEATNMLEDAVAECGDTLKEEFAEVQKKLQADLGAEDFRQKIQSEIKGVPFNDIGAERTIIFNAFDCNWFFTFKNDYSTNAVAEEFVATFQIFLQELYDEDLHLRPGQCRAHIIVAQGTKSGIQEGTFDQKPALLVTLSTYTGTSPANRSKYTFDLIVYAQGLLYHQSMLPLDDYEKIVGERLKNEEIIHKVTFGQGYDVLYREFITAERFYSLRNSSLKTPFEIEKSLITGNQALPWKGGISAKYDSQKANELIMNRINNLQIPLSVSLPLLKKADWFQEIVAVIRSEGWLDWQILHVLGHIIVNHKASSLKRPVKDEDIRKLFFECFHKDEKEWYQEIDESVVSEDRLRQELTNMLPIVLLPGFGLENRSPIPDTSAILKIFRERFNFFEDGKHINLFTNDQL